MSKLRLPNFIKTYLIFFTTNFLLFSLLRFIFLIVFFVGLTLEHTNELWRAFWIGAKFDFRLTFWLSIPFLVFVISCAIDKRSRKLACVLSGLLESVILLVYMSDFAHYAYTTQRISYSVFEYIKNPLISLKMAWETYPIVWMFLILMLCFYGTYRLVKWLLEKDWNAKEYNLQSETCWVIVILVFLCFWYFGEINSYKLRWSSAYHSTNRFICSLTINPVIHLYDTYEMGVPDNYDTEKARSYYNAVAQFLQVENADKQKLSLTRHISDAPKEKQRDYNVVIIFMESLAWNKLSLNNPELNPTPFIDKLAKNSILFTNFFAPAESTARAVFGVVTTTPDVTRAQPSIRNPLLVDQQVFINSLTNYEKYYFVGGSGNWANTRGILEYNIDGIKIYEEGMYKHEHHNDVWGISDLELFTEANRILSNEAKKPFFAFIQTAGFHRPYTIPDEHGAFELAEVDEKLLEKYSFNSIEEYNSLRFSDYALEEFFKRAQKEEYYENTIFFIFGDHGIPAERSDNMPQGMVNFNLIANQIPLIITGGPIKQAQRIEKTVSQVDVLPMAMGLLGRGYITDSVGRDVLTVNVDAEPGALIYSWRINPLHVGFIQGEYFYYQEANKEGLYKYRETEYRKNLASEEPERFEYMKNLAHGLYEISRYKLYHNQK